MFSQKTYHSGLLIIIRVIAAMIFIMVKLNIIFVSDQQIIKVFSHLTRKLVKNIKQLAVLNHVTAHDFNKRVNSFFD